MDAENKKCELCNDADFCYTCPKCNLRYCSVACYKSPSHLKCTEEFYKKCVQEELSSGEVHSQQDIRKMYEILKRMRQMEAGVDCNFQSDLDSDDDNPLEETCNDLGDESEDIAERLQGIDLNDAEAVWEHLSEAERTEFQKMIECGDIMKLVPDYKPWWIKPKVSKIVEIKPKDEDNSKNEPEIKQNIAKFSDICSKQPSACVHYNLWNVLSAYTCIVRFFSGEHITSPNESASHLVNLSSALKYGTSFEDTDEAVLSVETEAYTTGNGTKATFNSLFVESREQLKDDARQIMSTTRFKLMALSDMHQLFQLAKSQIKTLNSEHATFQKIFALSNGSVELNRTKLNQIIKRIDFFLSYVNRENANL